MKREQRRMMVGLGALAALLVLLATLELWPTPGASGAADGDGLRTSPQTSVSRFFQGHEIRAVTVATAAGEPYTIQAERSQNGLPGTTDGTGDTAVYTIADCPETMPAKQQQCHNLFQMLAGLEIIEELAQADSVSGDLTQYGFDSDIDNRNEIIVEFEDGEPFAFYVGAQDPSAAGTYIYTIETDRLLLVKGSLQQLTALPAVSYRQPEGLANWVLHNQYPYFDRMELYGGARYPLTVSLRPQTAQEWETSLSDDPSAYIMTEPMLWDCSDSDVEELLQALVDLEEVIQVAADFPESLAGYGITAESPYLTLMFQDEEKKLLLGSEAQNGWVYLHVEGTETVLAAEKAAAEFLFPAQSNDWQKLLSPLLIMRSIDSVETISFETPEKMYRLSIIHDLDSKLMGLLNGTEMEENVVRQLYMKLMAVTVDGVTEGNESFGVENEESTQTDYRISLYKTDGQQETWSFASLNDRQRAISYNEQRLGFYTNVSVLAELEAAITAAMQGEEP